MSCVRNGESYDGSNFAHFNYLLKYLNITPISNNPVKFSGRSNRAMTMPNIKYSNKLPGK